MGHGSRSGLDGGADEHPNGADQDGFPPAQLVTPGDDKERSEQTTDFVDGNDKSLDSAVLVVTFHQREGFQKHGLGDDAGHDALVISERFLSATRNGGEAGKKLPEEQEARGGSDADAYLQGASPDLPTEEAGVSETGKTHDEAQ